ncbi:MAG: primosomal protein N', partial [bacterium]|nr:primosomal protein N' [bacterium]
ILQRPFPLARIIRVDRDSTRIKGSLDLILRRVLSGETDILIGTQMLAKGHHFPNVTLVAILDADGGLFSADFRASEHMAQLVVQVAGRAGRGKRPGEVFIQTHHPEHPLLQALADHGYPRFARTCLRERQEAWLPPFSTMALVRSEATKREVAMNFLEDAHRLAKETCCPEITILGPVPAPMERKAGRYRFQLLIQSGTRAELHKLLTVWIPLLEKLKSARLVRWSLDVDPQEMT